VRSIDQRAGSEYTKVPSVARRRMLRFDSQLQMKARHAAAFAAQSGAKWQQHRGGRAGGVRRYPSSHAQALPLSVPKSARRCEGGAFGSAPGCSATAACCRKRSRDRGGAAAIRIRSARLGSARLGSARRGSALCGSVQFSSVQFSSVCGNTTGAAVSTARKAANL
jgi:hypothetical protein